MQWDGALHFTLVRERKKPGANWHMWKLDLENCSLKRKLGQQLNIILVREGACVETVFSELFSGPEIGSSTENHSGGREWKLFFLNVFRNGNWVSD